MERAAETLGQVWGVYLVAETSLGEVLKEESHYGKNNNTTNQVMELTAAIKALKV